MSRVGGELARFGHRWRSRKDPLVAIWPQAEALLAEVPGRHISSPMLNMQRIGDRHPHMPVNARTGIPAAVRLLGIVHAHGKDIRLAAEVQKRRQVILETEIAERIMAKVLAVDPDIAVAIDTVKLHGDFFTAQRLWRRKSFAIPAMPVGKKPPRASIELVWLYGPAMLQS